MEFISNSQIKTFVNNGFESEQLLFPENSLSERVTITRVTISPGASNQRHRHESSEQIWIALKGCGTLLLEEAGEKAFQEGDVVRFADNDIHGLRNDSGQNFVYMAITSPPINFRKAYKDEKK